MLAQEAAPFGVKVVSVEPGGMRTGWGEIARGRVPELLPDYVPSVGAIQDLLKRYVGNEVGDPEKVAQVILRLGRA